LARRTEWSADVAATDSELHAAADCLAFERRAGQRAHQCVLARIDLAQHDHRLAAFDRDRETIELGPRLAIAALW
jgi:hypothetical protein